MAVPRNRHSNARKNSKRAHHAKSSTKVYSCPSCGKERLAHRICLFCGHYKGELRTKQESPVSVQSEKSEAATDSQTSGQDSQ